MQIRIFPVPVSIRTSDVNSDSDVWKACNNNELSKTSNDPSLFMGALKTPRENSSVNQSHKFCYRE